MNRRWLAALFVLAFLGCYRTSQTASHMWQHYDRADDVQEQVRLGNIDRARGSARWLADHSLTETLPGGSAHYDVELRVHAQRVAEAEDITAAASATSQIGKTCGACHTAYDVGPRLGNPGSPPETSSFATEHMERQRWAADRMWEGLIGPSDERWDAGARVLSRAPLYQRFLTGRWNSYQQLQQIAERVELIARQAIAAKSLDQRAEIYGEFLGTCAACHTLVAR